MRLYSISGCHYSENVQLEPDLNLVIISLLKIKDDFTIKEQLSSKEIMC